MPNTFDPAVISGGSSSGSASVVARGWVPFALGTDTAGSGRVPAGLNNLVGLKPTRGRFSLAGVVPACRSLDCVSVFALTVADAASVADLLTGFDAGDAYSRPAPQALAMAAPAIRRPGPVRRIGIPEHPDFFGDQQAEAAWHTALGQWRQQNVELTCLDFTPMLELAALLYDGPWLAERHAAVGGFLNEHGDQVNPVVRGIVEGAVRFSATDAFQAEYRRQALVRRIDTLLAEVDALMVPTAPTAPTLDAVNADPVRLNSQLGTYTNFVNLADFCALAVPAGFRDDGIPFGVTLISGAWKDPELQALASQWLNAHPTPLGACGRERPPSPSATAWRCRASRWRWSAPTCPACRSTISCRTGTPSCGRKPPPRPITASTPCPTPPRPSPGSAGCATAARRSWSRSGRWPPRNSAPSWT